MKKRGKLNCLLFEPVDNTAQNPAGNQVDDRTGYIIDSTGENTGSVGDVRPGCPAMKGSVLFLPGMPGTDQSEDNAEDLCRMNYRVLCLSYSGSCGSTRGAEQYAVLFIHVCERETMATSIIKAE